MDQQDQQDETAAATLDAIRDGGTQLVLAGRDRLRDISVALDRGHFQKALGLGHELIARLHPLAEAEGAMATFQQAYVTRAADINVGAIVQSVGIVERVDVDTHQLAGTNDKRTRVTLHFEGDVPPGVFDGNQELLVVHPT